MAAVALAVALAAPAAAQESAGTDWLGKPFRVGAGGQLVSNGAAHRFTLPRRLGDGPARATFGRDWVSWELRGARGATGIDANRAGVFNALPGVALAWFNGKHTIKEALILKRREVPTTYRYALQASPGVRPRLVRNGAVEFRSRAGRRFGFVDPYMFDSSAHTSLSRAIEVDLERTGPRRWEYVLRLDRQWLRSPARTFPVVVDPTVIDLRPYNQCVAVVGMPGRPVCALDWPAGDRYEVCNAALEPCTSNPLVKVCYGVQYQGYYTCYALLPPIPTRITTPSSVTVGSEECLVWMMIFCLVPNAPPTTVPLPSVDVPIPQVLPIKPPPIPPVPPPPPPPRIPPCTGDYPSDPVTCVTGEHGGVANHGPRPGINAPDGTPAEGTRADASLQCVTGDVVLSGSPTYPNTGRYYATAGAALAKFLANPALPLMSPIAFTAVSTTTATTIYRGIVNGRILSEVRVENTSTGWRVFDFAACSEFYAPDPPVAIVDPAIPTG